MSKWIHGNARRLLARCNHGWEPNNSEIRDYLGIGGGLLVETAREIAHHEMRRTFLWVPSAGASGRGGYVLTTGNDTNRWFEGVVWFMSRWARQGKSADTLIRSGVEQGFIADHQKARALSKVADIVLAIQDIAPILGVSDAFLGSFADQVEVWMTQDHAEV